MFGDGGDSSFCEKNQSQLFDKSGQFLEDNILYIQDYRGKSWALYFNIE